MLEVNGGPRCRPQEIEVTIAIWTLFIFIALGAKVILALVTIFMLLPSDRRCSGCGQETLLMEMAGALAVLALAMGGRIERRWCPGCGWDGLGRCRPDARCYVPVDPARSSRPTRSPES